MLHPILANFTSKNETQDPKLPWRCLRICLIGGARWGCGLIKSPTSLLHLRFVPLLMAGYGLKGSVHNLVGEGGGCTQCSLYGIIISCEHVYKTASFFFMRIGLTKHTYGRGIVSSSFVCK